MLYYSIKVKRGENAKKKKQKTKQNYSYFNLVTNSQYKKGKFETTKTQKKKRKTM